ncbi:MAG: hypothetical protein B7733_13440 [Myxococcales bacterium FL481]|nr:MAG: hypothetical protein B7733_13440 [Myxococcales bacterium FL481]
MLARLGLVGALALASACASADGMQSKLYDTSRAYNKALRWADYDLAARHVPAPWIEAFLDEHERLARDVVIVDYELTRLGINRERGTAESRVAMQWHTERRLVVETTVLVQAWQWHEGAWLLVDERVASGEPLTFVPSRDAEQHPYLPGLAEFRRMHGIGGETDAETGVVESTRDRSGDQILPASQAPGP